MEIEILILLVSFISSIIGLTILGFYFRFRLSQLSNQRDDALDELEQVTIQGKERRQKAFQLGINNALGSIHEFIGRLALITKYSGWWFLSGPSKQAPIDMIGILDGFLHIIEIKKNGTRLSPTENLVKKMVDDGKVKYVVYDADIDFDGKILRRKFDND